ncbi:hypothetical protein ACW5F0_07875 [Luteimonas sp. A534]
MILRPLCALALSGLVALLSSCDAGSVAGSGPAKEPALLQAAADTSEPYVVKGRVTDATGAPITGVEVHADHTLLYDSHVFGITDANGEYRIELAGIEPSSWRVGATVVREFEGARHVTPLHVDDPAAFAGRGGAIRNLQWRLSGSDGKDGTLGAHAYIYSRGGYVDPEHIEVRFEPIELIDGSRGEPFTRTPDGSMLTDIPLGRHHVSVRYLPPGSEALRLPVRVRDTGGFMPSVEAGFRVRYNVPLMELEVEVPPGDA